MLIIPPYLRSAPAASGGGGGVSWSVQDGILEATVGAGSAQAEFRWDRPLTYTNAALYADPKTFRLYVGTSSGNYNLINGVDLSTTGQPGATHVRIKGLSDGQTVYTAVKAIGSSGNESSLSSEQSFVAAIPPGLPGAWDGDISSTTTISSSGDYRITSSFTGTITISASNVLLHGQDFTLSHSAGGVVLSSGVSNVEVRNIDFNPTSTGRCVQINGTLGSGNSLHHCALTHAGDAPMVAASSDTRRDLGGMRIYANDVSILFGGSTNVNCCIVNCENFRWYGNTITTNANEAEGRTAVIGESGKHEDWGNSWTLLRGDQACYNIVYEFTAGTRDVWRYIHDNAFTYNFSLGGIPRAMTVDGGSDTVMLWNDMTIVEVGSADSRFIRIRASDDSNGASSDKTIVGYNSMNAGGTADASFLEFGDTSSGGGSNKPLNLYLYRNTVTNYSTFDMLDFYGGSGFGNLYSWHNDLGGQKISSTGPGVWKMNHDNLPNGVADTKSSWEEFNCTIGGSQGAIQTVGSWAGFNPALYTPSAPTNLRSF